MITDAQKETDAETEKIVKLLLMVKDGRDDYNDKKSDLSFPFNVKREFILGYVDEKSKGQAKGQYTPAIISMLVDLAIELDMKEPEKP